MRADSRVADPDLRGEHDPAGRGEQRAEDVGADVGGVDLRAEPVGARLVRADRAQLQAGAREAQGQLADDGESAHDDERDRQPAAGSSAAGSSRPGRMKPPGCERSSSATPWIAM